MNTALIANGGPRSLRMLEPAIYALIGLGLIGQLFLTNGVITAPQAGMVLAGEAFGLMAACMASPLTRLVLALRDRPSVAVSRMAEIFPFVRAHTTASNGRDDHRDAA